MDASGHEIHQFGRRSVRLGSGRKVQRYPSRDPSTARVDEREALYSEVRLLGIDYIRLLTIYPRANPEAVEEPIRCVLSDYPFAELRLKYSALSYNWGLPPDYPIFINGKRIMIRHNLYLFLCRARDWEDIDLYYFWIDAVCIDQSNILERNEQVLRMATIFSDVGFQALEVYAWLGEADELSSLAMQHIDDSERPTTAWVEQSVPEDLKQAVAALLDRPFWTRVWTFQEVLLAPRGGLHVLCGGYGFDWDEYKGLAWFEACAPESPAALLAARRDGPRDYWHATSYARQLEDLLMDTRERRCLDPRDKVYGLLGCVRSGSKEEGVETLAPDYRLSTDDLFRRTMRCIIATIATEMRTNRQAGVYWNRSVFAQVLQDALRLRKLNMECQAEVERFDLMRGRS